MKNYKRLSTRIAYKLLWELTDRFGYSIQNKEIVPLKTCGNDPRELPYRRDWPYSVLHLPTTLGVGLRFFSLGGRTYHPFILALSSKAQNTNTEEFCFWILKKYSELLTLRNPNDFLGLNEEEACFPTKKHSYEYTYPWSVLLPHQVKDLTLNYALKENQRYGLQTNESLEMAFVSDEKLKIESQRLLSLLTSVRKKGFEQHYPDSLGCFVLINGKNYKWYVQGGQHRAAVLAALGRDTIPVHVRQIVRREDVSFWPNVQSGTFSEEQALVIFDRLFAAHPPMIAQKWIDFVNREFGFLDKAV